MNKNRELKILDLCKTCSDGTSDLQVVQCNASNQHGYAFRNAYINVLRQYHFIEYYTVSQQRPTIISVHTLPNVCRFAIFLPLDSARNLQYNTCHVFYHTLTMNYVATLPCET